MELPMELLYISIYLYRIVIFYMEFHRFHEICMFLEIGKKAEVSKRIQKIKTGSQKREFHRFHKRLELMELIVIF